MLVKKMSDPRRIRTGTSGERGGGHPALSQWWVGNPFPFSAAL